MGAQPEVVLVEHLSSEELSAYLTNSLNAAERENVERHLTVCAECRSELIEGQRAIASAPPAKKVSRSWFALAGLAAAAAVLIMVWPKGEIGRSPQHIERISPPSTIAPSVSIVSPASDAVLDASTRTFTWKRDDGSSYRVTITDQAGRPVWSQATQDTTVALPDSIRLAADSRYFWYVDALRPDGRSVTSGINSFHTSR
ncbi:MAG TPA: zf-HC2 domain-containing protein [Gemmatimonadaceae bacterium]